MGPETVALVASLAGTAATMYGQHQQEKERRSILNRQLERQDEATKKTTQDVLDEGQRYAQGSREQGLAEAEAKTYEQTQADLNGAGGANIAAAADNANVSDDFVKTKAARAVDEGNRLTAIAREAAKARAPGQLHMDDSLSMANLAGNLQNTWGTTKNIGAANALDAQSVKEPGYAGLGRIATAAGGAMAASGYGQQPQGGTPPNPYYKSGINWGNYRG